MKTVYALALLLSLSACDADDSALEGDAGTPDATPFCSPNDEDCGWCGIEGHACCFDPVPRRPGDVRPSNYCIDGSACAFAGSFTCFAPSEPVDAAPAPSCAPDAAPEQTCGQLGTECCAIDAGGAWCVDGLECGYAGGIWQCVVGSPS